MRTRKENTILHSFGHTIERLALSNKTRVDTDSDRQIIVFAHFEKIKRSPFEGLLCILRKKIMLHFFKLLLDTLLRTI